MIHRRKTLQIIGLATALAAVSGSEAVAEGAALWPERSTHVSQSTRALVLGKDAKAVAIAEAALKRVDGYDRLVALHNVCVGYVRLGQNEAAAAACDTALAATAPVAGATAPYRALQAKVEASIAETRRLSQQGTAVAQQR